MASEELCSEILKLQNGALVKEKLEQLKDCKRIPDQQCYPLFVRMTDRLMDMDTRFKVQKYKLLKLMRDNNFVLDDSIKSIGKRSGIGYGYASIIPTEMQMDGLIQRIKVRGNLVIVLRESK